MARTKLKKLAALTTLPNVFSSKNRNVKENLYKYFSSPGPFTLEIGCGHGDYSVELAQKFQNRNFVGIDVKGSRIFKGAIKVLESKLTNVAFVLVKAENLNEIFTPGSIEEIYVLFPEPHQKRSNHNRRLVSSAFITLYKELLVDSGLLHFKTDNSELFEFAIKNISEANGKILFKTEDFHNDESIGFNNGILTSFEKHYIKQKRKIKYICFKF
jgi:tRNA (guanine-N7-)-methyltransferase